MLATVYSLLKRQRLPISSGKYEQPPVGVGPARGLDVVQVRGQRERLAVFGAVDFQRRDGGDHPYAVEPLDRGAVDFGFEAPAVARLYRGLLGFLRQRRAGQQRERQERERRFHARSTSSRWPKATELSMNQARSSASLYQPILARASAMAAGGCAAQEREFRAVQGPYPFFLVAREVARGAFQLHAPDVAPVGVVLLDRGRGARRARQVAAVPARGGGQEIKRPVLVRVEHRRRPGAFVAGGGQRHDMARGEIGLHPAAQVGAAQDSSRSSPSCRDFSR